MAVARMEEAEGPKYVSVKTLAKWMQCSDDTIRSMALKGELEAVRWGGSIRISVESYKHYLDSHRITGEMRAISTEVNE